MKVSVVTVSFNSAKTIEDTIQSVLGQTYGDIEYIIVDGNSKDNTVEIVNKYKDKIAKIISEKDNGIYDAMNKGIRLATGDVVGILNSDDIYASEDVIGKVAEEIKNVDCVWGNLVYVKKHNTDKVVRQWQSSGFDLGKFNQGWHPPHPTFFVKRGIYEKYGIFRNDLSIAADYELMLRFLQKYKISSKYIPKTLVKMRVGGESNKNILKVIKANMECLKAFKMNDLKVNPLIVLGKPLLKLFQYFKTN